MLNEELSEKNIQMNVLINKKIKLEENLAIMNEKYSTIEIKEKSLSDNNRNYKKILEEVNKESEEKSEINEKLNLLILNLKDELLNASIQKKELLEINTNLINDKDKKILSLNENIEINDFKVKNLILNKKDLEREKIDLKEEMMSLQKDNEFKIKLIEKNNKLNTEIRSFLIKIGYKKWNIPEDLISILTNLKGEIKRLEEINEESSKEIKKKLII